MTKLKFREQSIGYALTLTASYFKLAGIKLMKENKLYEILTPEQFGILFVLSKQDGMYQRQISQLLIKDRPNVTRMLNILEKNGFAKREKDTKNKRISKIFITEKGRKIVEEALPLRKQLIEKTTKNISQKEIDSFFATLAKIRGNLVDFFNIQT